MSEEPARKRARVVDEEQTAASTSTADPSASAVPAPAAPVAAAADAQSEKKEPQPQPQQHAGSSSSSSGRAGVVPIVTEDEVESAIARNEGEIGRLEMELTGLRSRICEREKELACHMLLSNMLDEFTMTSTATQSVMQEVANILPPAWQWPEVCCARVTLFCWGEGPASADGEKVCTSRSTETFRETQWRLASDVYASFPDRRRVGTVEVFYLEERPERDEGPFLSEERNLLNIVAERLGKFVSQKLVEEQISRITGLLHICSCCRAVRSPPSLLSTSAPRADSPPAASSWRPIDVFLQEHCPMLQFSRSICPACASSIYAGATSEAEQVSAQQGALIAALNPNTNLAIRK
eukprot:m51a1_g2356 putative signaling protein (352) ;mRNA; f:604389-605578